MTVVCTGADLIGPTSARLNGEYSDGPLAPNQQVWAYWGPNPGGPYTNAGPVTPQGEGPATINALGLTPSTQYYYIWAVRNTDNNNNDEQSTECTFTTTAGVLDITCPPNQTWQEDEAITPVSASATGGTPPYTYEAAGLPAGLTINPATGEITGTPTADGSGTATITVTDDTGNDEDCQFDWLVESGTAIECTGATDITGTTATLNANVINAEGNGYETRFGISTNPGGPFNPTINTGATVDGPVSAPATGLTPGTTYYYRAFLTAGGTPVFGSATCEFVAEDVLDITCPPDQSDPTGPSVSGVAPNATGGTLPYTFSATGLPPGITINPTNGFMAGGPTLAGNYLVEVTVTDDNSDTAVCTFNWEITEGGAADLNLSKASTGVQPPFITVGDSYTYEIVVTQTSIQTAHNVSIEDLVPVTPAGVTRSWVVTTQDDVTPLISPTSGTGDISFSGLTLGPAAEIIIEVTDTYTEVGQYTNTVNLTADQPSNAPLTDSVAEPFVSEVSCSGASNITPTTAVLNGLQDGPGAFGHRFLYGTTPGGPYTEMTPVGSGGDGVKNAAVTGLTPSTTYYYILENYRFPDGSEMISQSEECSFTTLESTGDFTVTCDGADLINPTSARLHGTKSGDALAPDQEVFAYWGTTPGGPYTNAGPVVPQTDGPGTIQANGLTPNTTYYYIWAIRNNTNSNNDAESTECSFTTVDAVLQPQNCPPDNSVDWEEGTPITPITIGASGGTAPYTFVATDGLPAGLTIDMNTGEITGTPLAAGSGTATITVTDATGNTEDCIFDWTVEQSSNGNFTVNCTGADLINPTFARLNGTKAGDALAPDQQVFAYWGTTSGGPYTNAGAVTPQTDGPGTIQANGLTPNTTYYYIWAIRNNTNSNNDAESTECSFTTVDAVLQPQNCPPDNSVDWEAGTPITPLTIGASGGTAPYTFVGAGLPAGLTIDMSTGEITGTPAAAGSGTATITVTDDTGNTEDCIFDWTVDDGFQSQNCPADNSVDWEAGTSITPITIGATGGTPPYTFSATGLPAGLVINVNTGEITGTPAAAGSGTCTVTITDDMGATTECVFSWTVDAAQASPTATCTPATAITQSSATVNGTLADIPAGGSARFRRSTISGGPYANMVAATPYANGNVSANYGSLTPSTTYYYILEILDSGSNVVATSSECSFTTLEAEVEPPPAPGEPCPVPPYVSNCPPISTYQVGGTSYLTAQVCDANGEQILMVMQLCDGVPSGQVTYYNFEGDEVSPALPVRDCSSGFDFEQFIFCDAGNDDHPFISRVRFDENGDLDPEQTGTFELDGTTPYNIVGPARVCATDICMPPQEFCYNETTTSDVAGRMYDLDLEIAQGFGVEALLIDLVEFPLGIIWEVTDPDGSEFATRLQASIQSQFARHGATVTVTPPNIQGTCGEPETFQIHIECVNLAADPPTLVQLRYNAGRDLIQNPAYREDPAGPIDGNCPPGDGISQGGYRLMRRTDDGGTLLCTSVANRGWETNDRLSQFEVWCEQGVTQGFNVTPTPRGTPVQEINANGASNNPGDGVGNGDPDTIWQTFVANASGPFVIEAVVGGRTGTEQFQIRLSTGDTNDTGIGDLINDNINALRVTNRQNPWTRYTQTVNLVAGQTYTLSLRGPVTTNGPSFGGLFTDLRAFQNVPGERVDFTNDDDTCMVSVTETNTRCELWQPTCQGGQITQWRKVDTGDVLTNAQFWAQSPAPTCCTSQGQEAEAALGNLPYSDLVCGEVGGESVTLIRQIITDQSGGVIDTRFIGLDGAPVTPSTWTPGECAAYEGIPAYELQPFCFIVNDQPGLIHAGYAVVRIDQAGATTLYYYEIDTGTTHQPDTVTPTECIRDQDPVVLCDNNGAFLRHARYGTWGTILETFDTTLDGSAPYTPVGDVRVCTPVALGEQCYMDSGAGADCEQTQLNRVIWSDSPAWQAGNPTEAQIQDGLESIGTPVVTENTQFLDIQVTSVTTAASGLNGVQYANSLESLRYRLAGGGGTATLRQDFDEAVCAHVSTRVHNNMPLTITSDQPIFVSHNTSDPTLQGDPPNVVGNGTTSVTVTSPSESRIFFDVSNATFIEMSSTNNTAGELSQYYGLELGLPQGSNSATYRVTTYSDGSQTIVNVNDPSDQPTAIDPSWNLVPCNTPGVEVGQRTLCDDNGSFMRWYIYNEEGRLLRTRDTDLGGAAYETVGTPRDCGTDNRVISEIVVCVTENDASFPVIRRVSIVSGTETVTFIGSDGTVLDPAPTTWTPGLCTEDCGELNLNTSGQPSNEPMSEAQFQTTPQGTGILYDANQADVWLGNAVQFGPTGAGAPNVLRGGGTFLQADRPTCDDGQVTITVNIRHTAITAGQGFNAAARLVSFAGGPPVALDTESTNDTPAGTVSNWVLTATVPSQDLANGLIGVTIMNDTQQNGQRASEWSNFSAAFAYLTDDCPSSPVQAQVVRLCNVPDDAEPVTLCDANGIAFLRHIIYAPDGTRTVVDTELDAQTEYTPALPVQVCTPETVAACVETPFGNGHTGVTPVNPPANAMSVTVTVLLGAVTVTTATGSWIAPQGSSWVFGQGNTEILDTTGLSFAGVDVDSSFVVHGETCE